MTAIPEFTEKDLPPAPQAPTPPLECERCGLAPDDHTGTHWCDNQSFRSAAPTPPASTPAVMEMCERCQGNGEIVTDWERYKHPHPGDVGDEAVAECPDCDGTGNVSAPPASTEPVGDRNAEDTTIERLEGNLVRTIDERDHAEEMADRLAQAISKHFGADVGEHSSGHCPWEEALDIIEEAATANSPEIPDGSAPAADGDALAGREREHRSMGRAIDRACMDLPDGYEVRIDLERHAGTVHLTYPDGAEAMMEGGELFSDQISAAIDAALRARKGDA